MSATTSAAKSLRLSNPSVYGVLGAKKGQQGYVEGGWGRALKDAAAQVASAGGVTLKVKKPRAAPKAGAKPKGKRKITLQTINTKLDKVLRGN